MSELELNPRLARRPLDPRRKLPQPFAQIINPDGTANFAGIQGDKAVQCGRERLCGLCGEFMPYWAAFIAGPSAVGQGVFLDPPMHVECAEDAMRLCPHLRHERVPRRPELGESGVITPPGFVEDKPSRFGMYITRDWAVQMRQHGKGTATYVFRARPAKTIRWFSYVDGLLTEEKR